MAPRQDGTRLIANDTQDSTGENLGLNRDCRQEDTEKDENRNAVVHGLVEH